MTTKDFTANVISASKVVPDGNFKNSKASGVWDINEALDLIKGGNWPNAANVSPDAFVDALFSIDLWTGNDTERTITTGLDMSTNGGLVWLKNRDASASHHLFNTVSGATYYLQSNNTNAQDDSAQSLKSFGTTGFTIGTNSNVNNNSQGFCSWSFRKQPKFFDVVTYTGNGTRGKTVSHNLGSTPGMIIIKQTSGSEAWAVYHRSIGATKHLRLNTTAGEGDDITIFADTEPTSSVFSVGEDAKVNNNNSTYVAYLFAHNDDDGGFGEPGDQDIIKCGSYTGGGNTNVAVDLGFEPQWLLIKGGANDNWLMVDNMRGINAGTIADPHLLSNTSDVETNENRLEVNPTGFTTTQNHDDVNGSGDTYIYMAIRRGGMQTPTAASDVFQATASLTGDRQNGDTITTTLDHADWHFARRTGTSYAGYNQSRITGWNYLMTDAGDAEASAALKQGGDQNKLEYTGSWQSADNDVIDYFWKRARSFLDIVTWTGTGSDMNISHNLGVVPEMIWARPRSYADHWSVFHKDATYDLKLDTDAAEGTGTAFGTLTSSVMPVTGGLKVSSHTYIAFLFATAAGVSKVGTYTGNGSSQNIDCGFSGGNGASFVMIKNIDATGSWVVFDTARGLVTGNDVYIRFDVTNAEGGGYDFIDPLESGFTINQTGGIVLNESGENYLFWAIA